MRAFSTALIVAFTMALLAPSRLDAQETRHDQIAAQQAEKAARLQTETSPTGEKVLKRIMGSPLLSGSGGFFPWIGNIHSGTGVAAGGGYLRRATRGSRFVVLGAATPTGSATVDGVWSLPSFTSGGIVHPSIDARASRLEDLGYNGVGIGTGEDERMRVDFTPRELNAGVTATFARRLAVDASYGLLEFGTSIQGAPRQDLVASGEKLTFGVSRTRATWDWRTSPRYSTRGGFVRGQWRRYFAANDRPYGFDNVELEAAQLIPLVREQFVLAFHGLVTTTLTRSTDEVPFILLPSIGGGDSVRGFSSRRFNDRSRALLTGEYRWRPSRYLDMAIFVDTGTVAPRLRAIGDQPFKTAWGIGARMHGETFNALRIEAAHSVEGWRLVVATHQPF